MPDHFLAIDAVDLGYVGQVVVKDFSLKVRAGEFVSLLGPSGCGKTTVLRAIAGFLPVMAGRIQLEGRDITTLPPERRDVGIVFQNYALFPTMTVFENIAFALRVASRPRREIEARVREIAGTSGIEEHLDKKPANLSGGQQQRVAIARALIMGAQVLLLDEPLSNLDAKVRIAMRSEIKRLQQEIGFTALFVTHDQEDALTMSDRVVVLNGGMIEQIGTPRELYHRPATPFIVQFIGAANEIPAVLATRLTGSQTGRLFVRYENLLIGSEGLPARITNVEFLGPMTKVNCEAEGHSLSVLQFGGDPPNAGETVYLRVSSGTYHVFHEAAE